MWQARPGHVIKQIPEGMRQCRERQKGCDLV
jgi:hypothetical protein